MYINDMRWAGRLADDARYFPPTCDKDRALFAFRVIQTVPVRNKATGQTEQASQGLNVNFRCTGTYAERLCKRLTKGSYVLVDGELQIESKEVPGGRATFVTITATRVQFPPVAHVSAESQQPATPPPGEPPSAEQSNPGFFSPVNFGD